jgi:hypothetical protein
LAGDRGAAPLSSEPVTWRDNSTSNLVETRALRRESELNAEGSFRSLQLIAHEKRESTKLADKSTQANPVWLGGNHAAPPNPAWRSLALSVAGIQPKLTISRPGDPYEQEADQIAERVMRMANLPASAPDSPNPKSVKSKLPSTAGASQKVQRMCDRCDEEEKKPELKETETGGIGIQRKSPAVSVPGQPAEDEVDEAVRKVGDETSAQINKTGDAVRRNRSIEPTPEFHSQLESSKGGGEPLPRVIQMEMGGRMGTDFSDVRVHTNSAAHEMSKSINAMAFTLGHDIYFRHGNYEPRSSKGKSLLAHELTHTIQQAKGGRLPGEMIGRSIQRQSSGDEASEREKINTALKSKDPSDVKKIQNVNEATEKEKIELIRILIKQGWVGPYDEWKIEELWASFGDQLLAVIVKTKRLWSECIERGAELGKLLPALIAEKSKLEQTTKPGSGKSFGEVGSSFAKLKDMSHDYNVLVKGKGIYEGKKCEIKTPDAIHTDCTDFVIEVLGDTFAQQGRASDWVKVKKKYRQNTKARGEVSLSGLDIQAALQSEAGWKGIYWAPDPNYLIPREEFADYYVDPTGRKTGVKSEEAKFTSNLAKNKGTYYKDFGKVGYPGLSVAHSVTGYAPEMPKEPRKEGYPGPSPTKKTNTQLDKLKKLPFGILSGHGGFHMTIITYGRVIEVHWRAKVTSVEIIEQTNLEQWEVGPQSGYHSIASGMIVAPAEDVDAVFK